MNERDRSAEIEITTQQLESAAYLIEGATDCNWLNACETARAVLALVARSVPAWPTECLESPKEAQQALEIAIRTELPLLTNRHR